MISRFSANIVTDTSNNATVYVGPQEGISGRIHAIKITNTDMTTPTFTITGNVTGVPILVKTSAVTAWFYPRVIPNKNADGAAFTDVGADIHVLEERIKVAITVGGSGKLGSIEVWVDDGRT